MLLGRASPPAWEAWNFPQNGLREEIGAASLSAWREGRMQRQSGAALAAGQVAVQVAWEVVLGELFLWVIAQRRALPLLRRNTCREHCRRKPGGARALLWGLFGAGAAERSSVKQKGVPRQMDVKMVISAHGGAGSALLQVTTSGVMANAGLVTPL